jgi:hypothetical protein
VGMKIEVRPINESWIEGICYGGIVTGSDDQWVYVKFDNGAERSVAPYNLRVVDE